MPAGAPLAPDAVRLDRVRLGAAGAAAIGPGAARLLSGARAAHDLVAGQLVQRSDLATPDSGPDRRRVLIPVKDPPPVTAGDRVDLLLVSGGSVAPLVFNLEVVAAFMRVPRENWQKELEAWRSMRGITHLSVSTMGLGLEKPDQHVALLRDVREMVVGAGLER